MFMHARGVLSLGNTGVGNLSKKNRRLVEFTISAAIEVDLVVWEGGTEQGEVKEVELVFTFIYGLLSCF